MLLFLSFAIVGAATVNADHLGAKPDLMRSVMLWWACAVFPVLVAVLPLKDFKLSAGNPDRRVRGAHGIFPATYRESCREHS